jgi:hypothetical protein
MHTLIATAVGLLFLGILLGAERALRLPNRAVDAAFLILWLAATVVHGHRGILAGQTLVTEVLVGLVVFGVPTAALIALRSTSRSKAARRSIFTS